MNQKLRWLLVIVFAAAMAWVEAAVVLYLRVFLDRVQPYQPDPLPVSLGLANAELVREAATLIMLALVGWLAGSSGRTRLGYAFLAFGAWDILYYVFLVPLSGWPKSLLDWDILFLIPLPWWGPVLAPAGIAALMVATGTLLTQFRLDGQPLWPRGRSWLVSLGGAALALYVFMEDAIQAIDQGPLALRKLLPDAFDWTLFAIAFLLLCAPLLDMLWRLLSARLLRAKFSMGWMGGQPQ
jgi:hypothetical protein